MPCNACMSVCMCGMPVCVYVCVTFVLLVNSV